MLVAWQLGEGFFEVVATNRVVACFAHAQCRFTSSPGRVENDGFLEDGIDMVVEMMMGHLGFVLLQGLVVTSCDILWVVGNLFT